MNRRSGKVVITKDREHDQQIYIIDTGTYQLKVASGFAGSVYALINKITGTNYLKSSFPKAGPLVWFNPWYGGIRFDPFPPGQPGWFPTKLDRESWTIRETHRDDWSGVTLQVKPRKEEQKLKGLQFEFQVLSQPHSNIIALVQRIVNLTKAPRQVHNRLKIGLNPEGSPKGLETVVPRFSGVLRRRRVSTHGWPTSAQPYLGVEHMKDEVTLLFVEKQSPNGELYLGDLAPEVVQIFTEDPIDISSKKTKERVSYLIISNEPWEQTTQYEILKNLQL